MADKTRKEDRKPTLQTQAARIAQRNRSATCRLLYLSLTPVPMLLRLKLARNRLFLIPQQPLVVQWYLVAHVKKQTIVESGPHALKLATVRGCHSFGTGSKSSSSS